MVLRDILASLFARTQRGEMPQSWSSQDDDDPDDIDAWMAQRNAQVALRPEAEAAGRDLWNRAIQTGDDLYAGNPSDLTALGLAALSGAVLSRTRPSNDDDQYGGDGARPHGQALSAASGLAPSPQDDGGDPWVSELDVVGDPPSQTPPPGFLDSLNHNPVARTAAGFAGYALGLPGGVLRGGWHALEGVGHGLNFVGGLAFPDGRAKAWNEAQTATHDALQYGRSVAADPSRLVSDAVSGAKAANRSLNPFATPIPSTASGAFGHELGIGANGGEAALNVAGLVGGFELADGLNAIRTFEATRPARIAKSMAQGFDEPTALRLSQRYKGQGEHALIPKRQDSIIGIEVPQLKDVSIPNWIMDSPLNVSKPRGMSQGEFYEYHFGVDRHYKGGPLSPKLNGGKGWSGKRLGLPRYEGLHRRWARTPPFWKDMAGAGTAGETLGLLSPSDQDPEQ